VSAFKMVGSAFLLFCFVFATLSAPTPPTTWPDTFYSWMVTSVVKTGVSVPLYSRGQLIAYDGRNQYACRFDQQNLLNHTNTRPSNYCDGTMLEEYFLNDTQVPGDPPCGSTTALSNFTKPGLPGAFASAVFLGVDTVNSKKCNHFNLQRFMIDGEPFQIDAWFSVDQSLPCQVSALNTIQGIGTTWAFDGFTTVFPNPIPPACFVPKIQCAQRDWECHARPDADPGALGSALGWVCGQLDCSPINPGGKHFEPNTLADHCNWAFTQYFKAWKMQQGYGACNFNGVAQLVPPAPEQPLIHTQKRTTQQTTFWGLNLVC